MRCSTTLIAGLVLAATGVDAIIGGTPVNGTALDFTVRIIQPTLDDGGTASTSFICDAVLINRNTVITAAECTTYLRPEDIEIHYGPPHQSNHTNSTNSTVPRDHHHHIANVTKISTMVADNFTSPTYSVNDLAVLKITPITTVTPAKLVLSPPKVALPLRIVGWGPTLNNTSGESPVLNVAPVARVSPTICEKKLHQCAFTLRPKEKLCTSSTDAGAAGYGDAGGPVIDSRNRVVAIMIGNPVCAQTNSIGLKQRLTDPEVAAFIKNHS